MLRGGFRLMEFTSLEEWWGRHLPDYYAAFEPLGDAFDATTDVTSFLRAHLEAQLHQVRALDLRERVQRQIWLAIEDLVTERGLPERLANAVWDAFFDREVTNRYYREIADVGDITASTDLKGATAAGLLRALGAGRSRRYLAGDRLFSDLARQLNLDLGELQQLGPNEIIGVITRRVHKEVQARRRIARE
jgi:hypothetical protein